MNINHYVVQTPTINPPNYGSWKQTWHGLYKLTECKSEAANNRFKQAQNEAHAKGYLGERELEVDVFLSVLSDIKKRHVTFMELGAGYAEWCLALEGVTRNKLVNIDKCFCYAVEAEPQHYLWAKRHFNQWCIRGAVVPYAVSDKNGEIRFAIDENPADNYGQSITFGNSLLRSVGNVLRRKSITVNSTTLKSLFKILKLSQVDLIHMDVQGAEVRVIKGAMDLIREHRIDYWIIGTHGKQYNDKIYEILEPYYELELNIYPDSVGGKNNVMAMVQDGVQVYKRKSI